MFWREGNISPSPNAALRLDPESNQVFREEREWDVRRLCWSIAHVSKKCTQHTAARTGFGEGTRRAEFSVCIIHGGGWVQAKPGRKFVQGVSAWYRVSPVIWPEARGQCQVLNECGAAGAGHSWSPPVSVIALGVALGSGDTFLAFPMPPTANVQTMVAADVGRALAALVSLG